MPINLDEPNIQLSLEEENDMMRLAIQEMHQAIRWYVTTLSLAILTHNGGLIINNALIDELPQKELNFDVEDVEGRPGFVKVFIKEVEDELNTLPEKETD